MHVLFVHRVFLTHHLGVIVMSKVFTKHTEVFFQHDSSNFSIMILGSRSQYKVTFWHDDYGRRATEYITSRSTAFDLLTKTEDLEGAIKFVSALCDKYPEH